MGSLVGLREPGLRRPGSSFTGPPVGLTLNGVKKHVSILEEVDLVITTKVGRARECRLGPARLEDATGWIDAYRRTWERRLDRFGAYVEGRQ